MECDCVSEQWQRTFALHFTERTSMIVKFTLQLGFTDKYHHPVVIKKCSFKFCRVACINFILFNTIWSVIADLFSADSESNFPINLGGLLERRKMIV